MTARRPLMTTNASTLATNEGEPAAMTSMGLEDGQYSAEAGLLLRCMIAVAAADGVLLGKELDTIAQVHAGLYGGSIDRGTVAECFFEWQNEGRPSVEEILGPRLEDVGEQARATIFKAACLIMLSDGSAADSECRRLAVIASGLGLEMDVVIETLLALR